MICSNYFDFIIIGNLNFDVTETPKFVLVAGKTSGIESIILVMIDSKLVMIDPKSVMVERVQINQDRPQINQNQDRAQITQDRA